MHLPFQLVALPNLPSLAQAAPSLSVDDMGLTRLVVMASAMLVATLVASFAPLQFPMSQRRLASISTYSVGLLLGAALTIVIPEGVAAVYANSSAEEHHDHEDRTRALAGAHGHEEGHGHDAHANAQWIGIALLSGFVLMYIIDSLHAHDPPTNHTRSYPIRARGSLYRTPSAAAELEPLEPNNSHPPRNSRDTFDWERDTSYNPPSPPQSPDPHSSSSPKHSHSPLSTVVGLLVHSLADGISLGASSLSTSSSPSDNADATSLELLVFLAIMVHKAPAAFALSSVLSAPDSHVSPAFLRRSLLAFSFAAPVGAIVTYLFLSLVGAEGGADLGWWTGIALVFSGGTFLFVATHVMKGQEENGHEEKDELGLGNSGHGESSGIAKGTKMGLVLGGMVTPLILSKLVGHGH